MAPVACQRSTVASPASMGSNWRAGSHTLQQRGRRTPAGAGRNTAVPVAASAAAPTAAPTAAAVDSSSSSRYAILRLGGVRQMLQEGLLYTCPKRCLEQQQPEQAQQPPQQQQASVLLRNVLGVRDGEQFMWGRPYLTHTCVEVEVLEVFPGPVLGHGAGGSSSSTAATCAAAAAAGGSGSSSANSAVVAAPPDDPPAHAAGAGAGADSSEATLMAIYRVKHILSDAQ